jgi:hypothetical protein
VDATVVVDEVVADLLHGGHLHLRRLQQVRVRVDRLVALADLEMEMGRRALGVPGVARPPDELALGGFQSSLSTVWRKPARTTSIAVGL